MLPTSVENLLNKQVEMEAVSSNLYLAMASWCDVNGLPGCARFFYKQTAEEREHMMKIFHYVNESGGHALAPALPQPAGEFESLHKIVEKALDHEKEVTRSIHTIVEESLATKDYTTHSFLQWFLQEQLEEENQFNQIMDKIKLLGDDSRSVYLLDRELGAMAEQAAS